MWKLALNHLWFINLAIAIPGLSTTFSSPDFASGVTMATMLIPRSLTYEYAQYVEREIEDYKDSIPRSKLLSIGDEAVRQLAEQPQLALTELVLVEEVDRIIRKRLRIPSYKAWARLRLKQLEEFRRPEHWGLRPDAPLVRALSNAMDGHVLVAGSPHEGSALYLAAHGCIVTAVDDSPDMVDRVMAAAETAGLTAYVQGYVAPVQDWEPATRLSGVVYSSRTLAALTPADRTRLLDAWQHATEDGGVHLVETTALSLDELRTRYRGWTISVEPDGDTRETFLARKGAA
jgi:hypothetical protein